MEYRYKQKGISNGQETHKECKTTLGIRKIQIKMIDNPAYTCQNG